MKPRIQHTLLALALLSTFTTFYMAQPSTAFAQGTAFTYQGQLQNNGSPASGTYTLTFTLFNTDTGGVPIAGPVTNSAVSVANGLFTVLIDFGPGAFTGATNWLEVAVATNGAASFATLSPRQRLTPVPYALYAGDLSGTWPAAPLPGLGNANSDLGGNFLAGSSGNVPTGGNQDTVTGSGAIKPNIINGTYNTATGTGALYSNTSGFDNTADGYGALYSNTSGWYNTANGAWALYLNTNGAWNTANGFWALYSNTSGGDNTANGCLALYYNTSGSENTANGVYALYHNTSGNFNTANGYYALLCNTSGSDNTANGVRALYANTSGSWNTANGYAALFYNTNGSYNTANGYWALYANTSGNANTANGVYALYANTSGSDNTANGCGALYANTNGNDNTANGMYALYANTSGWYNTANGCLALYSNTNGYNNTASGFEALYENTRGSNNIALGYQAGYNITTGSSNIDIGNVGSSTDKNIIRIGTSQTATYLAGTVYGKGVALTSDRQAKENFRVLNSQVVLAKVAALPVTQWNYKTDSPDVQHIGPMAQDFQAAFQLNADDKTISIGDEDGVALAAIQGLNEKLEAEAKAKDAEIEALKQSVAELKQLVQSFAQKK